MGPSRIGLVVGVVVGLALVGLGFTARSIVVGYAPPYEDRVEQWVERDDGTVVIYDYAIVEGPEGQPRYEVASIDGSTSVVYLVDEHLDVRTEVFRGAGGDAETLYGSEEGEFQLAFVPADESTVLIYRTDEERDVTVEVFRGTTEEAEIWARAHLLDVVVFEGTRAEVEAWVDAEWDPPRDVFLAGVFIAAGVVAILAGLALAWSGVPRRLIFAVIGAAVGLLPAAVLRVFVESPLIEESAPELGALSGSLAFMGAVAGGALGVAVYGLSSRSR